MESVHDEGPRVELPACVTEYIARVAGMIRYRRGARAEVSAELTSHFEDALKDCEGPEQREAKARELIEDFGDPKLLAVLCRRAKKRCRPLWQKIGIRTAQAVGVLVLYALICSSRLFIGTAKVATDYLALLDHQSRSGRDDSLNAKLVFDQAAEAASTGFLATKLGVSINLLWPTDMNEPQRQMVAQTLSDNADALDLLAQGVAKPYYWADYSSMGELISLSMLGSLDFYYGQGVSSTSRFGEHAFSSLSVEKDGGDISYFPRYKELARTLAWRARWRAAHGDVEGAWQDCLVLQRFGWHLEGRGPIIEQLVGAAIDGLGMAVMHDLLSRVEVPSEQLLRAQEMLAEQFCIEAAPLDLAWERAALYDLVQRTFTDDGRGDGRPLESALPLVANDWGGSLAGAVTFSYPSRKEMMQHIDRFYGLMESLLREEPWQAGSGVASDRLCDVAGDSFILAALSYQSGRMVDLAWRLQTGHRCLVAILAVLRYQQDKGVLPDGLDALRAEGYLKEVPTDPYSGRHFVYRKTAESFILYSWGKDRKDDGGRQGIGDNGRPRLYCEEGDWVFWPYPE